MTFYSDRSSAKERAQKQSGIKTDWNDTSEFSGELFSPTQYGQPITDDTNSKYEYDFGQSKFATYGHGTNNNQTDNDVKSDVNGDNNKITQKVDNSVFAQSFGGDTRNFTYNGGMGESAIYDSPVSAATMGGFYEPKDGPKEAAKFMASYIGANKLHQRESNKSFFNDPFTDFTHSSDESRAFNPKAMQERIDQGPLLQRDRATVGFSKIFGDVDRMHETPLEWKMPKPPKPIESEAGEIAEDYKDELD